MYFRETWASELRLYQKITDIYGTSMDYNVNAPTTKEFFTVIQNKCTLQPMVIQ